MDKKNQVMKVQKILVLLTLTLISPLRVIFFPCGSRSPIPPSPINSSGAASICQLRISVERQNKNGSNGVQLRPIHAEVGQFRPRNGGYRHDHLLSLDVQSLASHRRIRFRPRSMFIYTILGLCASLCMITCSGHIAAETANGCCLYIYMAFVFMLFVVEAAVTADVFLNHGWQEGLSMLLAIILKALCPPSDRYYESDDEYLPDRVPLQKNYVPPQSYVVGESAYGAKNNSWNLRTNSKVKGDLCGLRMIFERVSRVGSE